MKNRSRTAGPAEAVRLLAVGIVAVTAAAAAPATAASDDPMRLPIGAIAAVAAGAAGDGSAWAGVPEEPILLSRTPPLYEGDPPDDGFRPAAHVALARAGGALLARLRWADATESRPRPPATLPDAGEPGIYKAHSRDIERFADAACVMVPRQRGELAAFPSLMMGEAGSPVDLYFWHLVRGFAHLTAAGRGTTTRTEDPCPGAARRVEGGWEVVFQLPELPPETGLAFAVWDGDRGQRDGLKWFSPWYEVGP